MPIEPVTAAAAVALIVPYLAKMGESASEKLGEAGGEAAGKVLDWLRVKLTGGSREALEKLERTPDDEDRQAALQTQIRDAMEADPEFAAELRALLPDSRPEAGSMTQTVSGQGAKAAQVRGSGNSTTIS